VGVPLHVCLRTHTPNTTPFRLGVQVALEFFLSITHTLEGCCMDLEEQSLPIASALPHRRRTRA
jgi:hypothetical protein